MTTPDYAAALAEEWAAIDELCASLSETEWKTASPCPGWSVQDCVAHVVGTESMLLQRPTPDLAAEMGPHVLNDIGRANELWVEAWRHSPGTELLAAFREVTGERLAALRAMTAEDFAADSWTPKGPGTYGGFMRIRVMDCWVHEQDIRWVLGRPGHCEGPAVALSLDEIRSGLPFAVGKRAGAPQGTTVVFDLVGPGATVIPIGVDGRAALLDSVPDAPTVTLRTTLPGLVMLVGGRSVADDVDVTVEGDTELGATIVRTLGYMI